MWKKRRIQKTSDPEADSNTSVFSLLKVLQVLDVIYPQPSMLTHQTRYPPPTHTHNTLPVFRLPVEAGKLTSHNGGLSFRGNLIRSDPCLILRLSVSVSSFPLLLPSPSWISVKSCINFRLEMLSLARSRSVLAHSHRVALLGGFSPRFFGVAQVWWLTPPSSPLRITSR